jgi:hypothetical protein
MDQTVIMWTTQLTLPSMCKLLTHLPSEGVMPCHLVDKYQRCGATWCLPTSQQVLPKWWRLSIKLPSVTTQKTVILILMIVITSNLMWFHRTCTLALTKVTISLLIQFIHTLYMGPGATLCIWNICSNMTHFMKVLRLVKSDWLWWSPYATCEAWEEYAVVTEQFSAKPIKPDWKHIYVK